MHLITSYVLGNFKLKRKTSLIPKGKFIQPIIVFVCCRISVSSYGYGWFSWRISCSRLCCPRRTEDNLCMSLIFLLILWFYVWTVPRTETAIYVWMCTYIHTCVHIYMYIYIYYLQKNKSLKKPHFKMHLWTC